MSVVTLELLRAAALGDMNRVRALLAQGVDINSTNKANQTALMLAAAFKQTEIVKFLLTAGANVNCHDELGLTALDWAQQHNETVQLINSGDRLAASKTAQASTATMKPLQTSSDNDVGTSGELSSVILRANKRFAQTVSSDLVATAVARAPITATVDDTVDSLKPPPDELTVNPEVPVIPQSAKSQSAPPSANSEDIPLPHLTQTRSPIMRTLFRVSIVLFLLVAGFVSYHLLTRKAGSVQPEPAPIPTHAATKPTKSAPVLSAELAGAELFLPDAEYPTNEIANGNVTVGVEVSRKGIVVSAKALNGEESLQTAAEKAAKSSAFAPEKLHGERSLINGTITYNFVKDSDSNQHGNEFGFAADAPTEVTATAGGPLAGAERKLEIPPVPNKLKVVKEAVTVVVRVSRTGRVISWRPLNAGARLRPWVIRGARASTFDPAKLPGEGDVVGIITYRFQ